MSNTFTDYCVVCGNERQFEHRQQRTEFDVRGQAIVFDVPVKACMTCGTMETEDGVDPAEMAFALFREEHDLLTPEEIKGVRDCYRLSQRSFADLLGMSEATINRYENGGLQDEAHDTAIRACRNAEVMCDLLQRHGSRLSNWQRQRAQAAIEGEAERQRGIALDASKLWTMRDEVTLTTGFRRFDYQRYAAVVVWFCRQLSLVTTTSLNKLLFYADFLHFRSESISLTGAAYRKLAYGPVPADYGGLRQQMELDQLVVIEEVKWENGKVGEKYQVGPNADRIKTTLSPSDVRILKAVAKTFEDVSPSDISDRSHEEAAWKDTEERALISYDKARCLSLDL
jgi:putative zinc finger/helix-turn-helix YgiT family protein